MKKVLAVVINPRRGPPSKYDQHDSFRGEGRHIINMGMGLALLDFDVNLVMEEWIDTEDMNKLLAKQINVADQKNITISNKPLLEHYDYLLTWDMNSLKNNIQRCDKAIFCDWLFYYVNDVYKFKEETKKDIKYIIVLKRLIEHRQKIDKIIDPISVNYMPVLFPLPSINVRFVPYHFVHDSNESKIYIYYNSTNIFTLKHKLIINFFIEQQTKLHSPKKIKLLIHTDSKETGDISNFEINKENIYISYLYNTNARYIDVINAIKSSDICITTGSPTTASNLADIVSLGKPLIYISDTIIRNGSVCFNDIYKYPEYLLYTQESDDDSIKKLNLFVENPKESYDKFKDCLKDIDFDNWKEFAKKYFIS